MTLVGFARLGIDDEPGATWIIPSALLARELHEVHEIVQKHRNNPTLQYGDEDPLSAEEMLRRKPKSRAEYDDDSEGDGIVSDCDEDFLFPGGGGPTNANRKSAALEELKRIRRKRRLSGDEDGLDPEVLEARMKTRMENDLEKQRKIKSSEFVVDSDEDEDADRLFFQKEEERRKVHAAKVHEVLRAGRQEGSDAKESKKRKSDIVPESQAKKSRISAFYSDSEDDEPLDDPLSRPPSRALSGTSSNDDSDQSRDTPLSSLHPASSQENPLKNTTGNILPLDESTTVIRNARALNVAWDGSDHENDSLSFTAEKSKFPKRYDAQQDAAALYLREPQVQMDDEELFFADSRRRRVVLDDSDDE